MKKNIKSLRDTSADRDYILKYNDSKSKTNDDIQKVFDTERKDYSGKIKPLFDMVDASNLPQMPILNSKVLALRQELQDSITRYLNRLSKENVKYKRSVADRLEYYMHGFGMKTASSEKTKMVDRDLAENKRGIELLQTHIEHLRDYKFACDQIQFAIKNIVALANYLG